MPTCFFKWPKKIDIMEKQRDRHIYFLGIGGIGMSALARYYQQQGFRISGYDKTPTELTRKLEGEGMAIHYREDVARLPERIEMVIMTPAIPGDHLELAALRDAGVPVYKRAEILGRLSRGHRTVAIGGTHGKTTTSSMTAWLMKSGGVDCTAFLGGLAVNFDGNYVAGESDWMVVEADEFDRSFLHLSPEYAAVLSIDADHLDIYGEGGQVREAYFEFVNRTVPGGTILIPVGWFEEMTRQEYQRLVANGRSVESFGLDRGMIRAEDIRVENGRFRFAYHCGDEAVDIQLPMAGAHNVLNALVAIRMASKAGVPLDTIAEKMALFKGIKRRFEWIYQSEKSVYIDDYAHHPTEIKAAIAAARALFPEKKMLGIFQPHLFTRTRDFMAGFAEALADLDELVLLEIYPAREKPIPGVSSGVLFDMIAMERKWLMTREELPDWLRQHPAELLMTLGAGDIDALVPEIKKMLEDAG